MLEKPEPQLDFFDELKTPLNQEELKAIAETERRTALAEEATIKRYHKKTLPHQVASPSGKVPGGWERDYYGNDPNYSKQ